MKAKMLLSVRRSAGLGDNLYYNNGPESINCSLKKDSQTETAVKSREAIYVSIW